MSIYPNYPDPQEREQEERKQDAITERKENERIEEKIKAQKVFQCKCGYKTNDAYAWCNHADDCGDYIPYSYRNEF